MYRYVIEREHGMGGDLGTVEYAFMPKEGETIEALGRRRFLVVEVIPAELEDSPFVAVLRLRELE